MCDNGRVPAGLGHGALALSFWVDAMPRDDGNVSDSIETAGPVRWRFKRVRPDGQTDIIDCINRQEAADLVIDAMAEHDSGVDGIDYIEVTPLNDQPANYGP